MKEENEESYDALLQEVQQKFLCYKKKSTKRFQEWEELIELAAQKMETLKKMKNREKGKARFVNPSVKSMSLGNDLLE